jgi:hypothetical protein
VPTKLKRNDVRNMTGVIGVVRVREYARSGNVLVHYVASRRSAKQIEALTETVEKVSDQIALSKPAPPLVANL